MEDKIKKELEKKLKKLFKFESFKSEDQYYATLSVRLHMLKKNSDILINLPPAAGKSICFQFPTMLSHGKITIVIIPDEYIGEEQISFLAEHRIKTFYICSKTYKIDLPDFFEEVVKKMDLKFIYVTANMLMITWCQILIKELNARDLISSIVIDEAHCISEHYGEITQSYREIYKLRDVCPHTLFIALTSIGTDKIIMDIKNYLLLKNPKEISHKDWRLTNFYLQVKFKDILDNPFNDMKCLIQNFMNISEAFSGIVYCSTCEETIIVAQQLTLLDIPTVAYCAKLKEEERNQNEKDWMTGKITMLAITYHYGMKLNKSSVQCIFHWNIPLKIEQYYQYIGKYTRNNQPILCRLYFSMEDWMNFQLNAMKMSSQVFKECTTMIEYCMSTECRHLIYSRYFGIDIHPCGDACDSCEKGSYVMLRQRKFQEFVNYHNYFSKTKHAPKIHQLNQTDNVKNLTPSQRDELYENLKKVLHKNYENSCCENKPQMETKHFSDLARDLEYSIFFTSYKQQDYWDRMVKLTMEIEASNELSNYILNYKMNYKPPLQKNGQLYTSN